MDDKSIIDLYWRRSEKAIKETDAKYGKYCRQISYNVLNFADEVEECVDDTYMQAWSVIPPTRPERLMAFLGRITRNVSLNRLINKKALKRSAPSMVVLDELAEIIPDPTMDETAIVSDMVIRDTLNSFLSNLSYANRVIFVRRYFHMSEISDIARDMHISISNVKITLFRLRKQLKAKLTKEGLEL